MKKLSLSELGRKSPEEYRQMSKHEVVLVLDNIRSGHNVGSFFRTADAFALRKIYLCGITVQPPHREIHKTAIGADQTVDWEYLEDMPGLLHKLKMQGYILVGIEQTDQSIPLQDFRMEKSQKYALIFGNEIRGLDENILPELSICLEIPQFGTKHSLNVSVAGGIVIWQLMYQILS